MTYPALPPRPAPLSPPAASAARLAGGLGHGLIGLGGMLAFCGLLLAFIGGVFAFVASILRATSTSSDPGDERFLELVGSIDATAAAAVIVGALVLGILFVVAGFLLSIGILRRSGQRAAAITWSGFGIAAVLWPVWAFVGMLVGQLLVLPFPTPASADGALGYVAALVAAISAGVGVVGAVVGVFAWWWMAHAFRS